MKRSYLFFIICITFTLYLFINPAVTADFCKNALILCTGTVIPCLFPFMSAMSILADIVPHLPKRKENIGYFEKVLGLPKTLITVCLLGLFGGAPAGAYAISKIYKNKGCTKLQAENCAILCNNCSVSFIMGVCACIFGSVKMAAILAFANILSVISVYFIVRKTPNVTEAHTQSHSNAKSVFSVTKSVSSSINSMINLCGYIMFFYTLSNIIIHFLSRFGFLLRDFPFAKCIFMSIFEMTSGVLGSSILSGNEQILLISFAVSFTGISIFFQVKDVFEEAGLSVKRFIFSKLLCGLLCPLYTLLLLFIIPDSVACGANSENPNNLYFSPKELFFSSIALTIAVIFLCCLLFVDKKHKK